MFQETGLEFFYLFHSVVFPITFLLLCFESKKQRKNNLRNIYPCMWLFSVHSSLSLSFPTQTNPVPHISCAVGAES